LTIANRKALTAFGVGSNTVNFFYGDRRLRMIDGGFIPVIR